MGRILLRSRQALGHGASYNDACDSTSEQRFQLSDNLDAPVRTRSACPRCGENLVLRSLREQTCISCDQPVRISWSSRRYAAYLASVVVLLAVIATYSRMSGGPWIVGIVVLWPLVLFGMYMVVTPTYEPGYPQPQVTLVTTFLAVFSSLFGVEFLGFLSLYVVLGGRPTEIRELLAMLSEPLMWMSPQFLITPDRGFLDAFGIMLGNSFLISLPVFLCVKIVQAVFRRNRVTQIALTGSVDKDDD